MYWISERRLPGSSATTVALGASPSARAARRARHVERDRVGQRMADVGRRRCPASHRSPARTETGTARGRSRARIFSIALAAPGPDRRADEVDGLDAGRLQPRLEAEVEVGRVDADEGVGPARAAGARRAASRMPAISR